MQISKLCPSIILEDDHAMGVSALVPISPDHTPIAAVHYRKPFQTGWAKLRIPNLPDISVRTLSNHCSLTIIIFEEKKKKNMTG